MEALKLICEQCYCETLLGHQEAGMRLIKCACCETGGWLVITEVSESDYQRSPSSRVRTTGVVDAMCWQVREQ